MKTHKDIDYHEAPYGYITTIPAGTPVICADNIPSPTALFWAEPWTGMDAKAESWQRNYGFYLMPRK